MSTWNEILDFLSDSDSAWLLETGEEKTLEPAEVLLREGEPAEELFFIIRGVFDVTLATQGDKLLQVMAAGEVAGEISFVTDLPRTATVTAREKSEVLGIDHRKLRERFDSEPGFGRRFFEGLCRIACQRLVATSRQSGAGEGGEDEAAETALREEISRFGDVLRRADHNALDQGGEIAEQDTNDIAKGFVTLHDSFNQLIYGRPNSSLTRDRLGMIALKEFLPILQLTRTAERFYSKPRGYAGDYYTIEMIYGNEARGTGRLGPSIDRAFLDSPAARAVQNRRGLVCEEIVSTVENHATRERPAQVMSIACGPAREVFDAYEALESPDLLEVTLLDIDAEAQNFVKERLGPAGLEDQVTMSNENILYVALGRRKMDLLPQNLIYSIGLIDYFSDKTVLRLLNYIHDALTSGGRVILGNFHPSNTSRAFMDYILQWKLIHRTEEDMHRLFEDSAFGKRCDRIQFEEQGINLFAECVKD